MNNDTTERRQLILDFAESMGFPQPTTDPATGDLTALITFHSEMEFAMTDFIAARGLSQFKDLVRSRMAAALNRILVRVVECKVKHGFTN